MVKLGSVHNAALTQVTRTRRVVFVEGNDYKVLRWFAARIGHVRLSAASDVAVISIGGFPTVEHIRAYCQALNEIVAQPVITFGVFDRDYRCDAEVSEIAAKLGRHVGIARILGRKEIENYLLVPEAIDRALERAIAQEAARTGVRPASVEPAADILDRITGALLAETRAAYVGARVEYLKQSAKAKAISTLTTEAMSDFDAVWNDAGDRLTLVSGKQTLARLNDELQKAYKVQVSAKGIIDAMPASAIPRDLRALLAELDSFRQRQPT